MSHFDIHQFLLSLTKERLPFLIELACDFVNSNQSYCKLSKNQRNLFLKETINRKDLKQLKDWIAYQVQREVTKKWGAIQKHIETVFDEIDDVKNSQTFWDFIEKKFDKTVKGQVIAALSQNHSEFTHRLRIQFVILCNELCDILEENKLFEEEVIKKIKEQVQC